jgi:MFS family permease
LYALILRLPQDSAGALTRADPNPQGCRVPIYLTHALFFLSFVTINAARIVLTLYALALGASSSAVGVLGGVFYLFPLLLSWPIGAAADRYGPRKLLLAGAIIGTGALVLPYFFAAMAVLYLAAALSGLSLAFFHVTLQNLIGTLSAPEERARNFSNFSLVGAVTFFVGPLIAGTSIDHWGHARACLAVAAVASLQLALLLAGGRLLPGPRAAPAAPAASSGLMDRNALMMLAASTVVQLGIDVFQFYMPIYGHAMGLSATEIGVVLASFAAASFVVRIFLARLVAAVAAEKLLAYAFVAGALGFGLIPMFQHVAALAAVAFVFGLGMGLGTPLTLLLMFTHSAEGRSGQTLGIRLMASNAVRVFGPMAFGVLAAAFGLWPVYLANAGLMASSVLLARGVAGPHRREQAIGTRQ